MLAFSRRSMLLGALAMGVTVVSAGQLLAKGGGAGEIKYEGTITSINPLGPNVTLKLKKGGSVIIAIEPTTKLERNDAHVSSVAAFKIGDRGQARIDRASGLTTKFEATGR